jgi:GrpB-like predicted nucleotidyltransferase (UPF0157 family)
VDPADPQPRGVGEPVEVVDYDPRWPRRCDTERERILAATGPWIVAIEHIGSTAVSGLVAKPVVDIMGGLARLLDGDRCVAPLEALGWEYRGEAGVPGRHYFRLWDGETRACHLHVVERDGDFWRDHLAFRDYLRADSHAAAEYARLKRGLARRHRSDRLAYTEAKSAFIQEALRPALGRA